MPQELSLKDLKNLQEDDEIDLSASGLTEVPRQLHLLPRLTNVDLGSNKLVSLPNEICSMKRLVKLELGNNRIHNLPNDIGNLASLQHLSLYNNQIEELPLSFANLKALKFLDLKNNPLEAKLAKVAGNCGNEKECRLAAPKVLAFVAENKRLFEFQKEKADKILKKIHDKNEADLKKINKEKAKKEKAQKSLEGKEEFF
ncbi:unnamed protein product [Caenorhabditis auriculariae]|uniref:Uncharacterized protein n=1 Tax=Caenorhabditis auriculariae TaxID=2777116 RepID=A0A8S1GTE2_9PELO|nr:unnamed protein product [Caenorhabditis auriculariae]